MTKGFMLAVCTVVGSVFLLAPGPAWAQIAPSAQWGEPINTPDRFVVLASYNNQAVYDQETGLVWEQSPDPTPRTWFQAGRACVDKVIGNRRGWRMPTIQEGASLIDPTQSTPALPAGHPFGVTNIGLTWAATTYDASKDAAFVLHLYNGATFLFFKTSESNAVWCVRGGRGVDAQ